MSGAGRVADVLSFAFSFVGGALLHGGLACAVEARGSYVEVEYQLR